MKNRTQIFLAALILVLLTVPTALSTVYTDYFWFKALGYDSVYVKIISTAVLLFLGTSLLSYLFFVLNAYLTGETDLKTRHGYTAALAMLMGLSASTSWESLLRFLHQKPFGVADPIFSYDISYYFFTLPFYRLIQNMLFYLIALTVVGVILLYLKNREITLVQTEYNEDPQSYIPGMRMQFSGIRVGDKAKTHLFVLAGLFFMVLGVKHHLDQFNVLYSESGVIYGASYADVNAFLPALSLLVFVSLVTGVLCIAAAIQKHRKKPGMWSMVAGAATVYLITLSLGTGLYPALIQQYKVQPNEYAVEEEYIKYNIEYTRSAFNLRGIEVKEITPKENASMEYIKRNRDIMENIRLWDWRPLKQTYKQLQEIRSYYDFTDVDVDRYVMDDKITQVMLSAREMNTHELSSEAQTWVNLHLLYTHGYGVCMSPVNEYTEGGLPTFIIKDIPPQTTIEQLKIREPAIYYGENAENFVVVKTSTQEFDYPMGDVNKYVSYEGCGGVPISSFFDQLMFALRFGDVNLILSEYITPESRIMFKRNIRDRVNSIAPFLAYDPDPYIVNAGGRLYWIIDAYTYSQSYPYSTPVDGVDLNYIRNSVKVVIDSYNGDISFYVVDEKDPLLETYADIYPALFRPVDDMPSALREHLRYPEALFNLQAQVYGVYHMTDPKVFYNKEDKWVIPDEIYGQESKQQMVPYYIITQLPGDEGLEFILMIPFTPRSKDNMIAWMAAKCDRLDYGELIIYKFPKEKLIYGPMQIEARIDQNDEISQQLTLWSQRGSYVIRGNLLVIPLEDTLLYVEPLYIQAEKATMPELKRIIVSYESKVVMEKTLDEAFMNLFSGVVVEDRIAEPGVNRSVEGLVDLALDYYAGAGQRLREGNWSGFGQELDGLGQALRELKNVTAS
ncbi:MAG: hypothetical protein B6U97_03540 [Candidatus Altiarchaeales archaeon ex4484_96]|nr:MAG: hypothetical protein B6U97_03540 [Candidatus Altiarchaeales archaeon ex4484_96]